MSQKSMHLSSIYTILFFSCMDRCWCHTTWWQKGSNTLKLHMHTLNIYTCIEQIHKQYRNHCVFMFVSIFFLVPFIGNIYKWYILPIGWLHATYHLLWEPKTSIVCFLQSATNSSTRPFPITKIHAFQERLLNGARELPYNMPPGMASAVGRAPLPPTTSYKTQGW